MGVVLNAVEEGHLYESYYYEGYGYGWSTTSRHRRSNPREDCLHREVPSCVYHPMTHDFTAFTRITP